MTEAGSDRQLRKVSVYPDVSGIDRTFHYLVPRSLSLSVEVGTIVRVPLSGRRVRGWVLEEVVDGGTEDLKEIIEVVSVGPSSEVIDLARHGAFLYAGRLRSFLLAASPKRVIQKPDEQAPLPDGRSQVGEMAPIVSRALATSQAILRLPPNALRQPVVEEGATALAGSGDLLVLVPDRRDVEALVSRLERSRFPVASYPEQWARAAGGGRIVVGTRSAVLSTVGHLGAIMVLDAHSEGYVEERAPTYSAVTLAAARARRASVPIVFVTPSPTASLVSQFVSIGLDRDKEREGWPTVEIIDRRPEDPRTGLYSERLARVVREDIAADHARPALFILNRKGRFRRLSCGSCGAIVVCEHCGAALAEKSHVAADEPEVLSCPSCGASRPKICSSCGSTRLRGLRVGVNRAAEELSALVGTPIVELETGSSRSKTGAVGGYGLARGYVGTEALLHQVGRASLVVFLDFDQELLAPRFRAGEEALALLVLAGRRVGGRTEMGSGRIVVQTRVPGHEVLLAAAKGDPSVFTANELERRKTLRLPPYWSLAVLKGNDLDLPLAALTKEASDEPGSLEVARTGEDRVVVRAVNPHRLASALMRAGLPVQGVRVEVDPLRV